MTSDTLLPRAVIRARRDRAQPQRRRVALHRPGEFDDAMPGNLLGLARPAVRVDIGAAREDGPGHVGDPADDQRAVLRGALPDRELDLALREIEELLRHDELGAQRRMARMKLVEQPHRHQTMRGRGRAGDAHQPTAARIAGNELALEARDRGFHALGMGQHLLAQPGEAVSGRVPFDQPAAELLLERSEPPVHGRLGESQRLGGRERAAVAGDGEEVAQVVPVEHPLVMHFWVTRTQCRGSPRRPAWRM